MVLEKKLCSCGDEARVRCEICQRWICPYCGETRDHPPLLLCLDCTRRYDHLLDRIPKMCVTCEAHRSCTSEHLVLQSYYGCSRWEFSRPIFKEIFNDLLIWDKTKNLMSFGLRSPKARLMIRRRHYAVYRLYRYYGLAPKHIARLLETKIDYVRTHIGDCFKEQCLKDTACFARPFFEGKELEEEDKA